MLTLNPEVDSYLQNLPADRRAAIAHLREVICNNLPAGFEEWLNSEPRYGFALPWQDPAVTARAERWLPLISFANRKHYVVLYHFGLYVDPALSHWYREEYSQRRRRRLNMGKSCLRFSRPEQIPFELVAELMRRQSLEEWLQLCSNRRRALASWSPSVTAS